MSEQYLTIERLSIKDITRIFAKVSLHPITKCWIWSGLRDKDGYGRVRLAGRQLRTHRLVYAWLVGRLPLGSGREVKQLDHLCRNPACCNPVHLELVLPRENTYRGMGPAGLNYAKTHCKQGHELSADNLIASGRGYRNCRTCCNAYANSTIKAKYANDAEYRERKLARDRARRQRLYDTDPDWLARERQRSRIKDAKRRARLAAKRKEDG